jgi:hypothetical protein
LSACVIKKLPRPKLVENDQVTRESKERKEEEKKKEKERSRRKE